MTKQEEAGEIPDAPPFTHNIKNLLNNINKYENNQSIR